MNRRAFLQGTTVATVTASVAASEQTAEASALPIFSRDGDVIVLNPFPLPVGKDGRTICTEIGRPFPYNKGIGFSPRHALQLMTGPGVFVLHPRGYDLVRRWGLSEDYTITVVGGALEINGVGFRLDRSLVMNEGIWEPEEGSPQRFRFSLAWLTPFPWLTHPDPDRDLGIDREFVW